MLLKNKNNKNEFVEFFGTMKPNDRLYNRFDNVDLEDSNIIESTAIKKVKKHE